MTGQPVTPETAGFYWLGPLLVSFAVGLAVILVVVVFLLLTSDRARANRAKLRSRRR